MLLGVIEAVFPGLEIPLAPRGDHFQFWGEGLIGEFEADLVVAFAGASVGDGAGALLKGNFHLVLGNYRAGERCSEQILMLVDGARLQRGENIAGEKFFAQVFDYDFARAGGIGFVDHGFEIVSLAHVANHGDDVVGIVLFQPRNDDGGVQASGVGEYGVEGSA